MKIPSLLFIALGSGFPAAWLLRPSEAFGQGCAMCATYLSGDDPRIEAFRMSILFLMIMPFALTATAGGWLAWMYHRSGRPRGVSALIPDRGNAE